MRKHLAGTVLILLSFAPLATAEPMEDPRSLLGDLWTELATVIAETAEGLVAWTDASTTQSNDAKNAPAPESPTEPAGIYGALLPGG